METISQEKNIQLERLLEGLERAGVPRWGRNKIVTEKTNYSKSLVARVLTGNVPLTLRFISAVCSAFSISKDWVETGRLPWNDAGNDNKVVSIIKTELENITPEDVAFWEAIKEVRFMPEPERWEAVAMLKRMNSKRNTG